MKSEYSYLQYHWCPIDLIVIRGWFVSSNKYSNRKEGRAKKSKISAGATVQIVSIFCLSVIFKHENLLVIKIKDIYITIVKTIVIANMA